MLLYHDDTVDVSYKEQFDNMISVVVHNNYWWHLMLHDNAKLRSGLFTIERCDWCSININNKESNEYFIEKQIKCMIYISICSLLTCLQKMSLPIGEKFYLMQALYQKFECNHLPPAIFCQAYYYYCKIIMHNYIYNFLVIVFWHP